MKKSFLSLFLVFFIAFLATSGCGDEAKNEGGGEEELVDETNDTNSDYPITISSTVPQDLAANATPEQLVTFAWDEFFALVWKSSYNEDGKRDNPDTGWSFSSDSDPYPSDPVVWETFAHRTELRPYDDNMLPFDDAPHYSFGATLIPKNTGDSFTLFNNLDEDNEIGSCNDYAYYDTYEFDNMVLYQAKCNSDEYNYILDNYPDKASLLDATTKTLGNIEKFNSYLANTTNTCDCPTDSGVVCLPCGGASDPNGGTYTGAMEIKTAWRQLTSEDDASTFFTRDVIVFESDGNDQDTFYYTNKTYALIGIHIIHKTENYPDFVFATFEHVGVEDDNMAYQVIDGTEEETLKVNYPRQHPIPSEATEGTEVAHSLLSAQNPNSIWLNYQLIGVQAQPSSDQSAFSFFLANYVIESDSTLASFQGSSIGNPHDQKDNILLDGNYFSQGGCQGCHGVAQITLGTDFSFLLDTVGKPVVSPDIPNMLPEDQAAQLRAYVKATAR